MSRDKPTEGAGGFWAHGVAFFGSFWLLVSRKVIESMARSFYPYRRGAGACAAAWDRVGQFSGFYCSSGLGSVSSPMVLDAGGIGAVMCDQGRLLASPDLSPAVLSTRDHRGASLYLPRHVPHPRMPLAVIIELMF